MRSPWRVREEGGHYDIINRQGLVQASVSKSVHHGAEKARLIAAAPQLRLALERLRRAVEARLVLGDRDGEPLLASMRRAGDVILKAGGTKWAP